MIGTLQSVKLGIAAVVLLAFLGTGVSCGRQLERGAHQKTREKHAKVLAEIARKAEEARRHHHAYVSYVQDAYLAAGQKHAQNLIDAERRGRATALAVRLGDVRLREHWRCDARPGAGNVQAAGAAAGAADAADLRAADIGRLHGLGLEADAEVGRCQAVVRAIYRLPEPTP